jgi:hypothetical protein
MIPQWATEANVEVQRILNREPIFIDPIVKHKLKQALILDPTLLGVGFSEFISRALESQFWRDSVTLDMIERDIERTRVDLYGGDDK